MRVSKQSQQFARQLFRLSLAEGQVSPERVDGVLAHLAAHPPRQPLAVLRHYHRLIAVQLAKNRALVEHAGVINDGILRAIEATFTQKYRRPVGAAARPDPRLIAGLRIRIGDDVYESSVAAQLTTLSLSL
ncbi:MAG: F0F1 ATP synthase subunit delta [Opitutaceae bacterium]